MSDVTPKPLPQPTPTPTRGFTTAVSVADVEAHVIKAKAAWRVHESAMTWEEKIAVIEKMRERSAQLLRARQLGAEPVVGLAKGLL